MDRRGAWAERLAHVAGGASEQAARPPAVDMEEPDASDAAASRPWVRALLARVERFARERRAHDPVVRVTLAGGERFSVCAAEPAHGAGFVTLHSHPERYDEMVATEDGGGCRRARSSSRWARSSRSS